MSMENSMVVLESSRGRKTKVLHVIDELSAGGAEKMLVLAANAFPGRDYEVGVVTLINPGVMAETLNPRVTFYSLRRTARFDWTSLRQLNRIARKYDLVHVHLKHTLKFVFLSWLLRPYKSKILLHDHSGDVLISRKNVYPFVMRWWIKDIFYLGVTQELTQWAIDRYKIKQDHSFSLPNVISAESAETRLQVEEVIPNGIRLVLVSNFRSIKNIEFSIRLIYFLHTQRRLPVHLTIYGQPIEKECYQSVLNLIDSLNLHEQITLDSSKSNVIPLLNQFDMAIHCSLAETGPLCLLEYMSAGLPFLTINRGHVPKEVKEQFAELVIDNFVYNNWIDRIRILFDRREQYKEELKNFFDQNYSVDTYYNKLKFVYSKIIHTYD